MKNDIAQVCHIDGENFVEVQGKRFTVSEYEKKNGVKISIPKNVRVCEPINVEKKDFAYYLTMFKIEGHETWRLNSAGTPDGFRKSVLENHEGGGKPPKITAKKVYRIDRLTGIIEEL